MPLRQGPEERFLKDFYSAAVDMAESTLLVMKVVEGPAYGLEKLRMGVYTDVYALISTAQGIF